MDLRPTWWLNPVMWLDFLTRTLGQVFAESPQGVDIWVGRVRDRWFNESPTKEKWRSSFATAFLIQSMLISQDQCRSYLPILKTTRSSRSHSILWQLHKRSEYSRTTLLSRILQLIIDFSFSLPAQSPEIPHEPDSEIWHSKPFYKQMLSEGTRIFGSMNLPTLKLLKQLCCPLLQFLMVAYAR